MLEHLPGRVPWDAAYDEFPGQLVAGELAGPEVAEFLKADGMAGERVDDGDHCFAVYLVFATCSAR